MAVRTRNVQATAVVDDFIFEGNTIRRAQTAPAEKPARKPVVREWESAEEELIERRRKNRIRREQQRAMTSSRVYVTFLSLCFCAMFLVCGCYLYLQASMSAHLRTIRDMENTLIDLRSDNDETLQRINSAIDLDTIRERAMNELGMNYPHSTQIVTYSVNESDTMTQYAEVP